MRIPSLLKFDRIALTGEGTEETDLCNDCILRDPKIAKHIWFILLADIYLSY